MTRLVNFAFLLLALTGACAAPRTPAQQAMIGRADCKELLLAADQARAGNESALARGLVAACPQAGLDALVNAAKTPAEAFLWCGRARAALRERTQPPSCDAARIFSLTSELRPLLTLGPADPDAAPDPLLKAALDAVGAELHLAYDHSDPVVYVGAIKVAVDDSESDTTIRTPDPTGVGRMVEAILHRRQARAEVQIELGTRTRTLHATEESRDTTWDAEPRFAIAARFETEIDSAEVLKTRAVVSLVRNVERALRLTPPETIDPIDLPGCLAYGIALGVATGDRTAASRGQGDPAKIAACERTLGMPEGAGIPVP